MGSRDSSGGGIGKASRSGGTTIGEIRRLFGGQPVGWWPATRLGAAEESKKSRMGCDAGRC
jgi:hypothetical protein